MMATNERQTRLVWLKQEPIDNWSTREKLALATAVQKIGNQNWGPVVRLLKPFAENDRPSDWFSPKFCALQYNDMFDKIEAPKRKRGERGEETTQDLIVKKYTTERLKELEQSIKSAFENIVKVKNTIDKLKSKNYDEKFLEEVAQDIRQNEQKKQENEAARQKWLAEREIKLSQISMKFRGVNNPRQVKMETVNVAKDSPVATVSQPEKLPGESKPMSEPPETVKPTDESTVLVDTPMAVSANKEPEPEKEKLVENDVTDEKTDAEVKTEDVEVVSADKEEEKDEPAEKRTGGTVVDMETRDDESSETNETVVDTEPSNKSEPAAEQAPEVELQPTPSAQPEGKSSEPSVVPVVPGSDKEPQDQSEQAEDSKADNIADVSVDPDGGDESKTAENDMGDGETSLGVKGGRRKRKKLSMANSNITIQTRSTRSSQITVKTEPAETVVSAAKEEPSGKQVTKKQRSNSIEEPVATPPPPRPLVAMDSEESNAGPATPASGSETPTTSGRPAAPADIDANFKKFSMVIVRAVQNHRCAPLLPKFQTDSSQGEFREAVYDELDINSIKKRIENGQLQINEELKRDLMKMFVNAIMLNNDPQEVKILVESSKEILDLIETSQPGTKTRDRIHAEINKRKTRGSGTKINEQETPSGASRRTRKPVSVSKSVAKSGP